MTLKEALDSYQFDNVGQFNGIARSLGYQTEYKDQYFRFHKDGEETILHIDQIRALAGSKTDESLREQSKERVAGIFDKDRANDPAYAAELERKGISIIRWENLKGQDKDGFTVIDHRHKVCYTGQSLYEYAHKNGNILDGKGTRLEKGILSDMMEINGKQGKLRFSENGISVFYRKEALTIPDKILGKKLSKKDKELLLAGEIVPLTVKKKDLMLQVDKDLNSVIVRSSQEIRIPEAIGQTSEYQGYKLTKADKYLLANGHALENILMHSKEGYFIADVRLTDDKKGIQFTNIQSLTPSKAQELIKEMTPKLDSSPKRDIPHEERPTRDMEAELREAIGKKDFEKLQSLKEEGYRPSEEYIRGIAKEKGLDEHQTASVCQVFGVLTETKNEQKTIAQKLYDAALKNDFETIQKIQSGGYRLRNDDLTHMRESGVQSNTLIAIQKIFGLKAQEKNMGDVRLANSAKPENAKDMARPIASTINRAFNDL